MTIVLSGWDIVWWFLAWMAGTFVGTFTYDFFFRDMRHGRREEKTLTWDKNER